MMNNKWPNARQKIKGNDKSKIDWMEDPSPLRYAAAGWLNDFKIAKLQAWKITKLVLVLWDLFPTKVGIRN